MAENFEDGVEYAGHHFSEDAWRPAVAKLLDRQWAVRYGRADTGEWVPAQTNQRLVVPLAGERTADGAGLVVAGEKARVHMSARSYSSYETG